MNQPPELGEREKLLTELPNLLVGFRRRLFDVNDYNRLMSGLADFILARERTGRLNELVRLDNAVPSTDLDDYLDARQTELLATPNPLPKPKENET